jgi:hypothetical protein
LNALIEVHIGKEGIHLFDRIAKTCRDSAGPFIIDHGRELNCSQDHVRSWGDIPLEQRFDDQGQGWIRGDRWGGRGGRRGGQDKAGGFDGRRVMNRDCLRDICGDAVVIEVCRGGRGGSLKGNKSAHDEEGDPSEGQDSHECKGAS